MGENTSNEMNLVMSDLTYAKTAIQNAYNELKKSYTGINATVQYEKCEDILKNLDSIISLLKSNS